MHNACTYHHVKALELALHSNQHSCSANTFIIEQQHHQDGWQNGRHPNDGVRLGQRR